MLDPILVANRGEIAWRVLRACRERDLSTVAVYSEVDRDAPWLAAADEAYLLGPAAPSESYLSTERILAVAERAGARAVHPGYGFLSENADFAAAVTDAGLTWVGPPPAAITAMGDKLSARAAAEAAGCPVVPGTMEPTDDPAVVAAFAETHGYPVAIKAAYGGGGRGLKVVRAPEELADALEGAQREAVASFGRGEVYVERYLSRPRHIEIQVLADAHGNVVHLGERDCSTQRRHQKLIEESPAPGLTESLRDAMGTAAIRVAREVGYVGAGTAEFLVEDGHFFFLEMNTRLQVEHPVTELVTGHDLVGWQLRVAAGEPLDFAQDEVVLRGHAIEARINAEHVAAGFAPSPGLITGWRPASGPGVRVDAGVDTGWEIPRDYDSLVAKLIAYGADRDEARRRLARACDEFVVEGVPTTLDFHRFALRHDDFVAGAVSTISVEREWDLSPIPAADPPVQGGGPRRASRSLTMEVEGRLLHVDVFEPETEQRQRRRRTTSDAAVTGGPGRLTAPMQGTIVKTMVDEGDEVVAGDLVVVLEAMKMENHVTADRDGTVTALHASPGETVNAGALLAVIGEKP
jgi:acetyl-CoA/propionyl-CoA carboxylase, biotin carboxylase, biotin carboxyl carrier protein